MNYNVKTTEEASRPMTAAEQLMALLDSALESACRTADKAEFKLQAITYQNKGDGSPACNEIRSEFPPLFEEMRRKIDAIQCELDRVNNTIDNVAL